MNYDATMQWLYAQLPMFQRSGKNAYKADLSNITKFCAYLGNPQNNFQSIHVAGTNGKGSTSHMIASVLQEAGYKTGLHTSPHLRHFGERSRINGRNTEEEFIVDFIRQHKNFIAENSFSFFEVAVALGFSYFAENKVDIAVIETGLGGRLDATNIISPEISIITNISLDHTAILGLNLPQIAAEKAGIIKPEIPVIIGEYVEETKGIFTTKANLVHAPIYFAEDEFSLIENFELQQLRLFKTDLKGNYQEKNKLTALLALKILMNSGWKISTENIRLGLLNVSGNTGLRGRWDILGSRPLIVADTGHNPAGIREIVKQIGDIDYRKLHLVLGFVNDKDIPALLSQLPQDAEYYFTQPDIPRKMPIQELKKMVQPELKSTFHTTVADALNAAKDSAHLQDMIFVGGSTFVVAEVI